MVKNNSFTLFYLFSNYDIIVHDDVPLHPDDVTILFLDYDVIVYDDVTPGYYDVTHVNLFLPPLVRLLPKTPANLMRPILHLSLRETRGLFVV